MVTRDTAAATANLTVNPLLRIRQASLVTKTVTSAVSDGGTPWIRLRSMSQALLASYVVNAEGMTTASCRNQREEQPGQQYTPWYGLLLRRTSSEVQSQGLSSPRPLPARASLTRR
jgi:hypothetical protein